MGQLPSPYQLQTQAPPVPPVELELLDDEEDELELDELLEELEDELLLDEELLLEELEELLEEELELLVPPAATQPKIVPVELSPLPWKPKLAELPEPRLPFQPRSVAV